MSKLKTGLTSRTIQSLQLNAGVLLSSYEKGGEISEDNIIGATRGGGSVVVETVTHQAGVDGAPTYTKGLERVDEQNITVSFTMVEFTNKTIKRAIVGSTISTDENNDTVITAVTDVLTDDYADVYWLSDKSSDGNVVIYLKNAFNTAGFNLSVSDKGEGTFDLKLVAHYEPEDLYNAPFKITLENS